MRRAQEACRRRLRPAGGAPGLGDESGPDREADSRYAAKADLVARRGYAAWPVPPAHAGQAGGRIRRAGELERLAHAHLRAVDPEFATPKCVTERQGPAGLPGARCKRAVLNRLHDPEPAD